MKHLNTSCAAIARLWTAFHVKHCGQYSVHRLLEFREFTTTTPAWRVAAAIALTPIPSLATIMVVDVVHLNPPSADLNANQVFYVRKFMTFCGLSTCLVQQCCAAIAPELSISTQGILAIALLTVVVNESVYFFFALTIGFPVPFTIQTVTPTYLLVLLSSLFFIWRSALQADPRLFRYIARGMLCFLCQAWMIVVYPLYYRAFTLVPVSHVHRLAFLSLLPVIKTINCHLFNHFGRKGDGADAHIPLFVIFNADVMGCLFTAFCMQNSPSPLIGAAFALSKVVHTVLLLRDTRTATREVMSLRERISDIHQEKRSTSSPFRILNLIAAPGVLDEVAAICARDQQVDQPVNAQRPKKRGRWCLNKKCGLGTSQVTPVVCGRPPIATIPQPAIAARTPSNVEQASELESLESECASRVTKLLYTTEFVILVEFVEVAIPVLYCLYLVVMFHLPNRIYYRQFAGLNADNLRQTIANVLLYTTVELGSLLVVHSSLLGMLRVSSIRQLAFVLSRQAVDAQSMLVLYVLYSTQSSLDHFGADYSFSFAWLSNGTVPTD